MYRVVITVIVMVVLAVPRNNALAQRSPIPITNCENITQPGKYVLNNDLVLSTVPGSGTGDCLVISSSHVNIDMSSRTINVACPPSPDCPVALGPAGGTAIHVTKGANHVSFANGNVQNFVNGIVVEANLISATNLSLGVVVGIRLNNVHHAVFTNISYRGADQTYHARNGPLISVNGGDHNTFTNISGHQIQAGASSIDGIDVFNSNFNFFSGVTMDVLSSVCGGYAVLLAGSNFNAVANSTLTNSCGSGIQIDQASSHNLIWKNTVTINSPSSQFAMIDQNPNCDSDLWINNTFSNMFEPGEISANPATCIH
jgi:hypothetical protein